MSLFDLSETIQLKLPNAEIDYTPAFFNLDESRVLFDAIYDHTNWIEEDIRVYGKVYKQPRLTAFYAINDKAYGYSNISMSPQPFNSTLNTIKSKIEKATQLEIKIMNSVGYKYKPIEFDDQIVSQNF